MLKLKEELNISLQEARKQKGMFKIFDDWRYNFDVCDWDTFTIDKKLTTNTDIDDFFIEAFKNFKNKPNKVSTNLIKLYLHQEKEKLIKNKKYNEEYAHIINFGNLISELEHLLNKNMYIVKNNSTYTMLHNDDLIQFKIKIDFNAFIILGIEINKTKICDLVLQKGKDIDIQYLAPSFTFDSLISLINNSIDILNIRNQKIDVKRNEFKNDIKNFYNEEKMEDLIKRIKNNV